MKKADIKTLIEFKAPDRWNRRAPYTFEVTRGVKRSLIPLGAGYYNGRFWVTSGRVYQSMGGIQFSAHGQPFVIPYRLLKVIRDGDGKPIWVNSNYAQLLKKKFERGVTSTRQTQKGSAQKRRSPGTS